LVKKSFFFGIEVVFIGKFNVRNKELARDGVACSSPTSEAV
jgi:hypothetical protein